MDGGFDKAMDQASQEYKGLFHKMRFIKKAEARVSATNMGFMRARDIEREDANHDKSYPKFCFTITAYNLEQQKWDKCPGCGDPDINKNTNGFEWQGCFRCHILLDKFGRIRSMEPKKKPEKKEEKPEPEPEFKTADEIQNETEAK